MYQVKIKLKGFCIGITEMTNAEIIKAEKEGFTIIKERKI